MKRNVRSRIGRLFAFTAIAAVTVAMPNLALSGAHAGSDSDSDGADSSTRGKVTQVQPGKLKRGAAPGLYLKGNVIHDGDETVRSGVTGEPIRVERAKGGYMFSMWHKNKQRVYYTSKNGRTSLRRVLSPSTNGSWHLNVTGDQLASVSGTSPSKLRIQNVRTGKVVKSRGFRGAVEALDFGRGGVVMAPDRRPGAFRYKPASGRSVSITKTGRVISADLLSDAMVKLVRDKDGYDGFCTLTTQIRRPNYKLWRSCKERPLTISPTAQWMVTQHIATDGLGPTQVRVRSTHGKLRATFKSGLLGGSFGWNKPRTFVATAYGSGKASGIRCGIGGKCVRTTKLVRANQPEKAFRKLNVAYPEW